MSGPREGYPRFTKTFTAGASNVPMVLDIDGAPRLPQRVIIWKAGTYELLYEPKPNTAPVEYNRADLFAYTPADDHAMEIEAPVAAVGGNTTNGMLVMGIY